MHSGLQECRRMGNLLFSLVIISASLCFLSPALATARFLRLSRVLDEPDPDATDVQLHRLSFIVVETASVELRGGEAEFSSLVSENDEGSLAFGLTNALATSPSLSLITAENGFAESVQSEDSPVASILSQNGLPVGLLPGSVEGFTLSDDGQFSVSLSKACYVDFDYEVYYAQTITGKLSYGAISDLSGIQAKKAFIWLSVTGIHVDDSGSSYICFDVGPFSKQLSILQFESVPVCKAKAMDLSALA